MVVLLISATAIAQSGPAGNWSGTYTYSIPVSACQNKTFSSSGNASVTFFQIGASLTGRIDLTNVLIFSGNCNPTNGESTRVLAGAFNASNVTWRFPNDSNGTQFTGSISGDSLSAQITDDNGGSGSLTLARASGTAPAVDLTGTWSGNYSFTDRCPNSGTQSYTGTFTIGLTQSGANAGGVVSITNVPLYDQSCRKITSLNMALSAAGVVSGTTFTGVVYDPAGSFEFPISATVSNSAMNGTVAGASETSTSGTFTLSRSSSQTPASDFAGTYDGSYSETDNEAFFCRNIGSLSYSGSASISIVQAGSAVSGTLTIQDAEDVSADPFGGCVVVNVGEEVLPLYGTLSGNILTLTLPLGGGAAELFTVTFSGDMATVTVTDSFGDLLSFSGTKSSTALPPVINAFASSPSAIIAGQSTTLSWSTTNATAASIDNGVGSVPATGSVTVAPTQTTVYTLTATGAGGSATAQTNVTVSPPGPRRRVAKP